MKKRFCKLLVLFFLSNYCINISFSQTVNAGSTYYLLHEYSGKYLCTGGLENGAYFHTWGPIPQGHEPRYRFKLEATGKADYYYLKHEYSGKYLCTGGLENDSKFHTWGPIPQGHQPRYRFKITQSGEGNNSSQINRTYPLKAQKNQKVQDQRYMNTTATLSRNGQLQVEIYSKTDKNAYGLRGGVVVTCWDDSGNLIYFCDPMWISTRCGRFDPSCDSEGIDQRNQNFPEAITRETARIEINHFVNSFHDMTKTFANGCKTTLEIAHIADDTAQEILKIVAKYKK